MSFWHRTPQVCEILKILVTNFDGLKYSYNTFLTKFSCKCDENVKYFYSEKAWYWNLILECYM